MAYDFTVMRQYSQTVNNLAFHLSRNNNKPFCLIYFPENHLFEDVYPKLNIERRETRDVIVPRSKIPVVFLESDMIGKFRNYGLLPYNKMRSSIARKNIIIDLSYYLRRYEIMFKPVSYIGLHGRKIRDYIRDLILTVGPQYRIVLIYSIDIFGDFNKNYLNRKSQMLINELKDVPNFVDDMLLCIFNPKVNYTLLIKEGEFILNRIQTYFRNMRHIDVKKELKEELKGEEK